MSAEIVIESPDGDRSVARDELPLSIGGDDADIQVPDAGTEALAYIGGDDDELFIQPSDAGWAVQCNGDPLTNSQWLRSGDVLRVGRTQITVRADEERVRLAVELIPIERIAKPKLKPPPRKSDPRAVGDHQMIAPAAYTPTPLPGAGGRHVGFRPVRLLAWLAIALLGATVWFTFTARTVEVRIDPAPETLSIEGTLLQFQLGGRYLLRPGTYTVVAERGGLPTPRAGCRHNPRAHPDLRLRARATARPADRQDEPSIRRHRAGRWRGAGHHADRAHPTDGRHPHHRSGRGAPRTSRYDSRDRRRRLRVVDRTHACALSGRR